MSKQPDPWRDIVSELAALKKRVDDLSRRSPYAGTGAAPNGDNGLVVDGDLIVDGNFDLNGQGNVDGSLTIGSGEAKSGNYATGASGWHLGGDGKAEFKDVTLYDLPNSMLANPVTPGVVNLSANNFSSAFPWFDAVSTSLTVPAGCSRLLLTASAWVQINNSKTTGGADGLGSDYIYARVALGATTGQHTSTGVSGNSGTATASSGLAGLLSGLTPGGTVTLAGQASTDYNNATSTLNKAVLVATLFWLK